MLAGAAPLVVALAGWRVVRARDHDEMQAGGNRHVGRLAPVDVILTAPGVEAPPPAR
ncbi:MAG TPA: hypothetical protein PKD10_05455 [Paracoccaceae bacterium]|nr:hypothetical protein [Paracoccaceae bacterium]HMO72533.1 hypothetical protein [Paracoccaceae bacterium]